MQETKAAGISDSYRFGALRMEAAAHSEATSEDYSVQPGRRQRPKSLKSYWQS